MSPLNLFETIMMFQNFVTKNCGSEVIEIHLGELAYKILLREISNMAGHSGAEVLADHIQLRFANGPIVIGVSKVDWE